MVAFWKEGRSWNAELFHLEVDGTLEPFDRSRLEEIKAADPAAVILNGYYCGHLGENMSLDELTAGVRHHYKNGTNDVAGFIEAHDDRLPPELIEEARAAAHAAGLPFSREFKIHTTDYSEEGQEVGLTFFPEDIHVMPKVVF